MTSIDYLVKEFSEILGPLTTQPMQDLLLVDAINKAKEMHKQEIIDAVLFGMQKGLNINKVPETDNDWLNNYYQETFKKD